MTHPNLDPFLGRLKRVSKTRDGWKACCPAHDDHEPSLSVIVGRSGGIVVHCFSQHCTAEAIAAAVGMELLDFAPPADLPSVKPADPVSDFEARIVTTYDYHDAAGTLVYQVVRLRDPKEFRQRRPTGARLNPDTNTIGPVWKWNLGNTSRVPYRLPHLLTTPLGAWLFVCEGEKDADALVRLGLAATTNAGGAGKWHTLNATPVDQAFRGRRVAILPDRDRPGLEHAAQVAQALAPLATAVKVVELPGLRPKGDVSDWLAADPAHTAERLMTLVHLAPDWSVAERDRLTALGGELARQAEAERSRPAAPPRLSFVINDPDLDKELMIEQCLAALGRLNGVYCRENLFCHVTQDAKPPKWLRRPERAPVITLTSSDVVRVRLATVATFCEQPVRGAPRPKAFPPDQVVRAMADWPNKSTMIRVLEGVSTAPVFRADGEMVQTSGYDPDSGVLYLPDRMYPPVPASPDQAAARAAADRLFDVVCDVPFERPHHRAAWLALVLTLAARHAVAGCVPLFAVDANQRGTGKGLAVDAACLVASGRRPARTAFPADETELEKRLFAIALAGDQAVLFDNVDRPLRGASLELALTARVIGSRILGMSRQAEIPFNAVLMATGNNLVFSDDAARRTVPIRLDYPQAEPETRTGFRHPRLEDYVHEHHPRLLVDALTVLRAYHLAGRPRQNVRPYGSFEAWSDLVRSAVVWLGEPDPCAGRAVLLEAGDPTRSAWLDVLELLPQFYPFGTSAVKLSELVRQVERRLAAVHEDEEALRMRDALVAITRHKGSGMPNPVSIGNVFNRKLRTVMGDKMLVSDRGARGYVMWKVVQAGPVDQDSPESQTAREAREAREAVVPVPPHAQEGNSHVTYMNGCHEPRAPRAPRAPGSEDAGTWEDIA